MIFEVHVGIYESPIGWLVFLCCYFPTHAEYVSLNMYVCCRGSLITLGGSLILVSVLFIVFFKVCQTKLFCAFRLNEREHIVLGWSVCMSVCLSSCLSVSWLAYLCFTCNFWSLHIVCIWYTYCLAHVLSKEKNQWPLCDLDPVTPDDLI